MFCTEEVWDVLQKAEADYRSGRLLQDLELFLVGGMITVSEEPYKHPRPTYMARTDPVADEIWDIRSRDPKPGIRVLGGFAEKDHCIALTLDFRDNLGGPESKEWRDFIVRSTAKWRQLFPTYPKFQGANVSEYLSEPFEII